MLINHVNNEIISYQSYVFKFLMSGKKDVITRLASLRDADTDADISAEIQTLENQLRSISEQEIERALAHHPLFEHLNGEKMSPHFLKLCKGVKSECDLNVICDDNGVPFPNDSSRNENIVKFLKKSTQSLMMIL
jgi:hypothetical protein